EKARKCRSRARRSRLGGTDRGTRWARWASCPRFQVGWVRPTSRKESRMCREWNCRQRRERRVIDLSPTRPAPRFRRAKIHDAIAGHGRIGAIGPSACAPVYGGVPVVGTLKGPRKNNFYNLDPQNWQQKRIAAANFER